MNQAKLVGFETWAAFLEYLKGPRTDREVRWIWYQAPCDALPGPRFVRIVKVYKNGKVRIDPCSGDADSFTADSGHLSRVFRDERIARQ